MFGTPVVASRPEPTRAARIPEKVRLAITDMVELGDDFVSAGKRHSVTAQMMRRWLGRAECISFLRKSALASARPVVLPMRLISSLFGAATTAWPRFAQFKS
jgi:hypothetical protein